MTILSWTESYGNEMFRNFNMTELGMDEAYVRVKNKNDKILRLYSLVKECVECPYTYIHNFFSHSDTTIKIDTKHDTLYKFSWETEASLASSFICEIDEHFGEFGVYELAVNESSCSVDVLKEPVNIYFPILTVFLIYFTLSLLVIAVYKSYPRVFSKKKSNFDVNSPHPDESPTKKKRLKSLDTFRGISITIMIFVNYGAGGYVVLEHAIWNGLQLADVVFPWFMWIMGVCIPISVNSVLKRNVPIKSAVLNVFRRSCILFALGLFLGGTANLDRIRIFGVLQRFGICYFVVGTLCLLMMKGMDNGEEKSRNKIINWFKDVIRIRYMWGIILLVLTVYCLIIFLLHVPDCPTGYLGPGGLHNNSTYLGCTGGATGYIDRLILGRHMYQYPTILEIYKSQAFDPEGILGCLTSIVQVFIGVQAGITLLTFKDHVSRLIRWLGWGILTGVIGGALCCFSKEDGVIPVNKNLWSISFVLVTSSFAFILLSACYVLIDVKKYWSGKPLLAAGMNAIIMYVGHSITHNNFPVRWYFENDKTHFMVLTQNVWSTLVWLLVAAYLYRKKYFLSI